MSLQNAEIYVAPSDLHGKGVFAARDIEAGEILEICPVLIFPKSQLADVRRTFLDDYYFDWGDDGEKYALALGYGSIYNHSYEPNAEYDMDFEAETIDVFCIKDLKAGDEILINYNGYPSDKSRVWFEEELKN